MIQRYDLGEVIWKSGDYWSDMTESKDGDYVTHEDHRAAVRELVEALQLALHHIPTGYDSFCGRIRAAIEKATGGEG